MASKSQLRSHSSVVFSSPDKRISFFSCEARKEKCACTASINSDTFSCCLFITMAPASNLAIFKRLCTSASTLSSSCSLRMAKSRTVGWFSASSCINNVRFTNTFDLDEYFKCILSDCFAVIDSEEIDREGQEEEYIMLRLRTSDGIDLNEFKKLFGCEFTEKYSVQINKLKDSLDRGSDSIKIKDEFLFVQNSIIVEFFN